MGFSVVTSNPATPLLNDIALAQQQVAKGEGEMALPQQGATQELPCPTLPPQATGLLKGEARPYLFSKEELPQLPVKISDYLPGANRPQLQKSLDLKATPSSLSVKEKPIKEKEITVLKLSTSEKQGEKQESSPLTRSYSAAKHTLETARGPQSAAQLRDAVLQQNRGPTRNLETKLHREFGGDRVSRGDSPEKREEVREKNRLQEKRSEKESLDRLCSREKEKIEQPETQKNKEKDPEREGFGGGGHHRDQDNQNEEHQSPKKKIEAAYQAIVDYGLQPSILSEILNMRVSQFDVLILFMEILKLDIKGREQEKISRREEREHQLAHMQKVVENFREEGSFGMKIGIGSGVMAILSGVLPIVGHMKGDDMVQGLGAFFESWRDVKKDQIFKSFQKITGAMSEVQKRVGEIQHSYSEGSRTYDQHMSDIYRTDWEERTRTIDELKESWKGIENFLYQTLQMQHDTTSQLYRM